jgi:hypothetical protein
MDNSYFQTNKQIGSEFEDLLKSKKPDFYYFNQHLIKTYIQFRNRSIDSLNDLTLNSSGNKPSLFFESFIFNWISFNMIYTFYSNEEKEFKKIKEIYKCNVKIIKEKINLVINNDDFPALVQERFFIQDADSKKKNQNVFYTNSTEINNLYEFFKRNKELNNLLILNAYKSSSFAKTTYEFIFWRLLRIRNALFHGSKSSYNPNDADIVERGAKILNLFLSVFELDLLTNINFDKKR